MNVINNVKKFGVAAIFGISSVLSNGYAQKTQPYPNDTFTSSVDISAPSSGTCDINILKYAPNPDVIISGENKKARIVVDLKHNILFKYNTEGEAEAAYAVASGKASTPTHTGVRVVTHIEKYPYKYAPRNSKRYKTPKAFGPYILCLNKLNPSDGSQSPTGEFIHGNNNPSSIGKYASHGCIRMDNSVITELSKEIKAGDIVIMKR